MIAPDIQFRVADVEAMSPATFEGFDVKIVDPPYSEHVHRNAASAGTLGEGSRGWHRRDLGFSPLTPALRMHLSAIGRVVRRWSVVFSDYEGTHLWRQDFTLNGLDRGHEYIRRVPALDPDVCFELPWVRWSQPQKSGDRPGQQSEAVLHFHSRGAKHWNGPGSLTHYVNKSLRGDDKHPTEKPLDLLLNMVSWFSDPGESVVDPCAGAGTTALACKLLGRNCLAIEKDPTWEAVAARRLAFDWADRDVERVRRWVEETRAEASAQLAKPAARDGSDAQTRARAERRLADVERVVAAVSA